MKPTNDNDETAETIGVYFIDASKVHDGMKISLGSEGYLFRVHTRDFELPNGEFVRIAGVEPIYKDGPKKPELII